MATSTESSSSSSWPRSCRYFNPAVMEEAYYKGLLDRIECTDGPLTCFEVLQGQKRSRTIAGREPILKVLNESEGSDVRFFFINDVGRYNFALDSQSICLPKESWEMLLHTTHIHPAFVEHMQKKFTGAYATFNTVNPDGALEAFHLSVKVPSGGFLEAAFFLRFENLPRKRLTGIYIGNDLGRYMQSVQAQSFTGFEDNWGFSILLPILRQQSQFLRQANKQFGHNIAVMERDLQRGSQGLAKSDTEGPQRPTEQFMNTTHQCAGNERVFLGALDFHGKLTNFIQSEFLKLLQSQRPRSSEYEAFGRNDSDLIEALTAHHTFTALQANVEREGGLPRAAALLQATDSLINQIDSKSSAEIATQSTSIAEQTRQDGLQMKRIAEESKALTEQTRQDGLVMKSIAEESKMLTEQTRQDGLVMKAIAEESKALTEQTRCDGLVMRAIAEDARRDSNSMRTIAILGMLYLPTSTIATICGTVFVNNGNTTPGITIDSSIWAFWLASIVLTILTVATWIVFLPGGWRSLYKPAPARNDPEEVTAANGIELSEAQTTSNQVP